MIKTEYRWVGWHPETGYELNSASKYFHGVHELLLSDTLRKEAALENNSKLLSSLSVKSSDELVSKGWQTRRVKLIILEDIDNETGR